MERVFEDGGWDAVKRLIDMVTYLELEDFRKRLFCFVAAKMSIHTLD